MTVGPYLESEGEILPAWDCTRRADYLISAEGLLSNEPNYKRLPSF